MNAAQPDVINNFFVYSQGLGSEQWIEKGWHTELSSSIDLKFKDQK